MKKRAKLQQKNDISKFLGLKMSLILKMYDLFHFLACNGVYFLSTEDIELTIT